MRILLLLVLTFSRVFVLGEIKLETVRGSAISLYIPQIVNLCAKIYRSPPYCYDGENEEYTAYLEEYACLKDATVSLVFDDDEIVGLAAGLPMCETRLLYTTPLVDHGYDLTTLFYLGEFGLDPKYQNQGIEKRMYQQIEEASKKSARFSMICLWEIEDHSVCPHQDSYLPKATLLQELGFLKCPELSFQILWTNIDESEETAHTATYWLKSLSN